MNTLELKPSDRKRYEREMRRARGRDATEGPRRVEPLALEQIVAPEALRAAEEFAEPLVDWFDPWSFLTVERAASARGIPEAMAASYVTILKARKCWPYRGGDWETVLKQKGSIGPFRLTPKDPDCRFASTSYSERKATAKAAESLARILAVHEPGSEVSTRDVMAVLGIGATAVYRLVARLKGSGDWPFEAAENRRAVAVDSVAQSCIGT